MNRREFMKGCVAAIGAAALPGIAVSGYSRVSGYEIVGKAHTGNSDPFKQGYSWDDFDPLMRYGNSMPLTYDPPPELQDKLVELLYQDMVKTVPPVYRDRVQIVRPMKTDYGRRDGIAWLYLPPGSRWQG